MKYMTPWVVLGLVVGTVIGGGYHGSPWWYAGVQVTIVVGVLTADIWIAWRDRRGRTLTH